MFDYFIVNILNPYSVLHCKDPSAFRSNQVYRYIYFRFYVDGLILTYT